MNTEFERGLHKNYMIIKAAEADVFLPADIKDSYQIRMLSDAGAKGFLGLKIRYFNGKEEFCYDISSKQKLSDWFRAKKINNSELKSILNNLCEALANAEDYLLDAEHIVLNPDYIFSVMDNNTLYLCYCPLFEEDITKSGQEFLQYLLEIIDYNDKEAVEMGYEVFRLCMKAGFGINIIRECLGSAEKEVHKEEWNSIVPVSVMKEEVEEEVEKPIIPYIELPLRKKICLGLMLTEGILTVAILPHFSRSWMIIVVYLFLSVVLIGGVLALSIFYNKLEQYTRVIRIKGYVAYEDKNDGYVYGKEEEDSGGKLNQAELEETVLLAYTGRNERFRRLHYIGTRMQEDIILTNYPFTVGKADTGTDYRLLYPFVSRLHFKIDKIEDRYYITDMNSRNGLLINDKSLNATETRELFAGDRIEIGDLVFLFQ